MSCAGTAQDLCRSCAGTAQDLCRSCAGSLLFQALCRRKPYSCRPFFPLMFLALSTYVIVCCFVVLMIYFANSVARSSVFSEATAEALGG